MTERKANLEGLYFTGHYASNYNDDIDVKEKAKELRNEAKKIGFKIRIVIVEKSDGRALYAGGEGWDAFKIEKAKILHDRYFCKNHAILLSSAEEKIKDARIELSNLKKDIIFSMARESNRGAKKWQSKQQLIF